MLAVPILANRGRSNLNEKLEEMRNFLHINPTSTMEVNCDKGRITRKGELLAEEEVMSRVLHSKRLHNKAKLMIFEQLDEIESSRRIQTITKSDDAPDMAEI